jgi:hypothetical protein
MKLKDELASNYMDTIFLTIKNQRLCRARSTEFIPSRFRKSLRKNRQRKNFGSSNLKVHPYAFKQLIGTSASRLF